MTTFVQALQKENSQVRVICGDKWAVFDEGAWEWVVYQRKYGQRKTRELYRHKAEVAAVAVLIGESDEENRT